MLQKETSELCEKKIKSRVSVKPNVFYEENIVMSASRILENENIFKKECFKKKISNSPFYIWIMDIAFDNSFCIINNKILLIKKKNVD